MNLPKPNDEFDPEEFADLTDEEQLKAVQAAIRQLILERKIAIDLDGRIWPLDS